ncbi:MAG: gliding motility protein RemB, partial [Flavobacteriaceae bacterium]|nr:gliding motility protein RemB [Flavobacteriaceae bacterium]
MRKPLIGFFLFSIFNICLSQNTNNKSLLPEHDSHLNIPLTFSTYNELESYYHKGENSHTAAKPFIYSEAKQYVNLTELKEPLFKDKSSWFGRKWWNEHMFIVQEDNFWFTINPGADLQVGKDNSDAIDNTYNNTRSIQIQGGIGKNLSFSTSFYESQGRFANYINRSVRENPPIGAAGVVPGRGKGKAFKNNGFDYPVAEAYLSYSPNTTFNFQFGNGKNFIGDGYRSFMLSDVASPYPFFKISTKFWKIKYTNLWMWLDDVRRGVSLNSTNFRKYVAVHHLSWNVSKRLNLGLFEAVITDNRARDGFDPSFYNPIIFYRAVEFTRGSESGNAMIGLNGKYKVSDNFSLYTQFVLDELTVGRFLDGDGSWGNKFAFQIGGKYYNAFK